MLFPQDYPAIRVTVHCTHRITVFAAELIHGLLDPTWVAVIITDNHPVLGKSLVGGFEVLHHRFMGMVTIDVDVIE